MFNSYSSYSYIEPNIGNGVFSQSQKVKKSLAQDDENTDYQLYIPSIRYISSLDEIQLTQENTLIVRDEKSNTPAKIYHGLAHIYVYIYRIGNKEIPIYICDNHNHALYFWMIYIQQLDDAHKGIYISHIDQHSDLLANKNSQYLYDMHVKQHVTESFLYDFVHRQCHVGNFVDPFLHIYPQTQFQWIKSEYQLLQLHERNRKPTSPHIVDIDLDFWAPEMSLDKKDLTIIHTKRLIENSDIVTIATSPYYIDQALALDLLRDILL